MEQKLQAWIHGKDKGLSSEATVAQLTGVKLQGVTQYPSDAADFGRCERLLRRVPELRGLLSLVGYVSPQWEALVNRWYDLAGAYDRKPGTVHLETLMKEVLGNVS